MTSKTISPTLSGCLALLLWSTSATLVTQLKLPTFEALSLVSSFILVATLIKLSIEKKWTHILKQLKIPGIRLGYGALSLNNIAYYLAFYYAPPIEVDLITWLWPASSIVILCYIGQARYHLSRMISIGLCLTSLWFILPIEAHWGHAWLGYGFAFIALFSWCYYTYITQQYPTASPELAPLCIGLSCPITWGLHQCFEQFISPSHLQYAILITLALGSAGVAFLLWDYGIKKGQAIRLCYLAYLTPALSVLWLVLTHQEPFSWSLGIGCLLILAANIIDSKNI